MKSIIKEPDGKFLIPDGWMWRKEGESIRRGDLIASFYFSHWENSTADWWGKKVKPLDLVIRRIR
jgi:hypothetical protein